MSGGGDPGAAAARQAQLQQDQITQATGQINKAFQGFTPQFFNQRAQDYEAYALPFLNQQQQQAQNQANFKLFDQGLQKSSQAKTLGEQLGKYTNQQKQGVANEGIRQAQSLQQQIAQEQQNLIGQANAAANPASVGQEALGQAAQFSAPSSFAPVGNLFQNFANTYLANQLTNTYSPALYGQFLQNPYASAGGQTGYGAGLGGSQSIF